LTRRVLRYARLAGIVLAVACGKSGMTDTPRPTSISLAPESATLRTGTTLPLTVAVRDASGNSISAGAVFWSSSDAAVAAVSTAGIVSGRAPGTATIAATARGLSATATITVENRVVATVQVAPAALSVLVGATAPLTVRTLDAEGQELTGRTVVWSTSSPGVAAVDASGRVTGVGTGSATITAASEGRTGATVVTVNSVPVATVALSPALDTLQVGETTQLAAGARDAAGNTLPGRSFSWSASDTRIATVSSTGLVVAIAPGTATVRATSEGRTAEATIVVRERPVATVALTPPVASVVVGGTLQLTARPTDVAGNLLAGRPVTYASSNMALATVDAAGLVTGRSPGNVTITATSEGRTGTAAIRVDAIPVAAVQVAPANPVVVTGGTVQLVATPRSASGAVLTGRAVSWQSGAPAVASVSGTGLVTALSPGSVVIIAEVEGVTASSTVTVRAPDVAAVLVSPATVTLAPQESTQLNAEVRDALGNTLAGRNITWSSSDESVAFVTSSGSVLAFRTGTATITATSEGVSGSARITVR
jgi:uncharacterized protein YjdB